MRLEAKHYSAIFSSGTTGTGARPTLRYHSGSAIYGLPGMRRPAILTGTVSLRVANASGFLYHNNKTESVLVLDKEDIGECADWILKEFRPDSFFAFPSFLLRFLARVRDVKILERVGPCIFVGEAMTLEKETALREKLPHALFIMHYSSSELGSISVPCALTPRNTYHSLPGIKVEILDEDGGIGEIAITKEVGPSMSVKRFPTGDLGRFVQTPCPCGASKSFEVLGRKDFDFIKLAGALLRRDEFDRVLLSVCRDAVADYRGEVRESIYAGVPRGIVSVKVVPTSKGRGDGVVVLATRVAEALRVSATKTFADLVSLGALAPLSIEFTENFPESFKETRLRRVP